MESFHRVTATIPLTDCFTHLSPSISLHPSLALPVSLYGSLAPTAFANGSRRERERAGEKGGEKKSRKQCSFKWPHRDNICSGWIILNVGLYNFEAI